jgi:hypothetical protein
VIICKECNHECQVITVDFGIGAYEYWGAHGVDVQLADVSNCCEASCVTEDEDEPPPDTEDFPYDENDEYDRWKDAQLDA